MKFKLRFTSRLTKRLLAELDRFGSATHPIAKVIPLIVKEYRRSTTLMGVCLLLFGIIIGGSGSLWVLWHQFDAIEDSCETMAAVVLNPKVVKTNKAQSQAIVQKYDDVRNGKVKNEVKE